MSTCLITGCALVIEGNSLWGDLHEEQDCYIFNGVLKGGEALWQYGDTPPPAIKQIVWTGGWAPFERRGVVILPKKLCELNQAAKDYLK